MGARRLLLPIAHSQILVPVCTGQVNPEDSNCSLEEWWTKKHQKNHDYFSSAEQKTVFSVEEEFVPLTSDEENQNKKQDQLTQK